MSIIFDLPSNLIFTVLLSRNLLCHICSYVFLLSRFFKVYFLDLLFILTLLRNPRLTTHHSPLTTHDINSQGGFPAGRGVLAARLESGDPTVRTSRVENAVYVAAGDDPYQLMEVSDS
jgi:hypothetical protein